MRLFEDPDDEEDPDDIMFDQLDDYMDRALLEELLDLRNTVEAKIQIAISKNPDDAATLLFERMTNVG